MYICVISEQLLRIEESLNHLLIFRVWIDQSKLLESEPSISCSFFLTEKQQTYYFRRLSTFLTNLISFGLLLKKRYSFDTRRFYVLNKFNKKVAYAPLQETYSQSRRLIKEPNNQNPKNRQKNLTYLHCKQVPLLVVWGCSN